MGQSTRESSAAHAPPATNNPTRSNAAEASGTGVASDTTKSSAEMVPTVAAASPYAWARPQAMIHSSVSATARTGYPDTSAASAPPRNPNSVTAPSANARGR
jgi:hypothetical protein